jgi:hypothetical protein
MSCFAVSAGGFLVFLKVVPRGAHQGLHCRGFKPSAMRRYANPAVLPGPRSSLAQLERLFMDIASDCNITTSKRKGMNVIVIRTLTVPGCLRLTALFHNRCSL